MTTKMMPTDHSFVMQSTVLFTEPYLKSIEKQFHRSLLVVLMIRYLWSDIAR